LNGQLASSSPSQAGALVVQKKAVSPESKKEPVVVSKKVVAQAATVDDVVIENPKAEAPKPVQPTKEVPEPKKEEPKKEEPKAKELPPTDDYKTLRIREMAELWKGTVLEPHTVKLLAMLIVEDGTMTAERRHDCSQNGAKIYSKRLGRYLKGCFAMGIQGHNIAARGTPIVSQDHGKPWKLYDYDYAMTDFEKDYPGFSFDWRVQFAEYTKRMAGLINDGYTVNQAVQSWNSKEAGRIKKVENHQWIIRQALGL
jgi:hypothetical protein